MVRHKKKQVAVTVKVVMTDAMKARRDELIEIVKTNMAGFRLAAEALLEIWKNAYYSEKHKDFGEFCMEHFGFGYNYARKIINADATIKSYAAAAGTGAVALTNEAQARALSKAGSPKDMVKAMSLIKKQNLTPSAEIISAAVRQIQKENEIVVAQGQTVNPLPTEVALAIEEGKSLMAALSDIKAKCNEIDKFAASKFGVCMPSGQLTNVIRKAVDQIKLARPYADCVYCGSVGGNCSGCGGRGWLTKTDFDSAPENLKQNSLVVTE